MGPKEWEKFNKILKKQHLQDFTSFEVIPLEKIRKQKKKLLKPSIIKPDLDIIRNKIKKG